MDHRFGAVELATIWMGITDAERDRIAVALIEAGHEVELVARLMCDLGHDSTVFLRA